MSSNLVIAMWSGPRNLSTALMRSFGNRSDVTCVMDEPFYASYLKSTNKDHPMQKEVIESQPNNIDNVKKNCQSTNQGLTYQKHMTHHMKYNMFYIIYITCYTKYIYTIYDVIYNV